MRGLLGFLGEATTPADRAVLFAVWAAMAAFAVAAWSAPAGREAVVLVAGKEVRRLDLTRNQRVTVPGRLGPTEIRVADGAVRFVHSPCHSKRCIRRGWQQRQGEAAACVPNRILVRVAGAGGERWDAVNY